MDPRLRRQGAVPAAIVPIDAKAPVVALIVYMRHVASRSEIPFTVDELARWIHGYGDRVCSRGDRPYGC